MATQKFRDWLLGRETEIALDIEDLGDLREEFEQVMGRPAAAIAVASSDPDSGQGADLTVE